MVESTNFIKNIILNDKKSNTNLIIQTRFPPEPNGHLHFGHAKSIFLNFGLAELFKGNCNLRFDDTNPTTENITYVNSIIDSLNWLGFKAKPLYASDYFDLLYEYALIFIKNNLAYVDSNPYEKIKELRGTLTKGGTKSQYRERTIEENLKLFDEMKNGVHKEGTHVLRLKIDMSSPNINMRDPVIYRIKKLNTTEQKIIGRFFQCMTIHIVYLMQLKILIILYAPLSLKITGHYMIGY